MHCARRKEGTVTGVVAVLIAVVYVAFLLGRVRR
jgi:hypothetical protein